MAAMSKQAVAKVQAGRDSGTGDVDDDGGDGDGGANNDEDDVEDVLLLP